MSSDSAQVGLIEASRRPSADPQMLITEAERKLLFEGSEEKRRILMQSREEWEQAETGQKYRNQVIYRRSLETSTLVELWPRPL